MTEPIVAQSVRFASIEHGASLNRVFAVCWKVVITNLDGTEQDCCASTYGHRTKKAARDCVIREMNRRIKLENH